MISTADVLDFLVARSMAPSTMGAQLQRLRDGTSCAPDPFRARDEVEANLIQNATLIRCIDQFAARQELPTKSPKIEKIQRECRRRQGDIALGVLRAFHERFTGSGQERALVETARYIASIAPNTIPKPPANTPDLLMAFREGKARRLHEFAAEAYADALLALQAHCRAHNKRERS